MTAVAHRTTTGFDQQKCTVKGKMYWSPSVYSYFPLQGSLLYEQKNCRAVTSEPILLKKGSFSEWLPRLLHGNVLFLIRFWKQKQWEKLFFLKFNMNLQLSPTAAAAGNMAQANLPGNKSWKILAYSTESYQFRQGPTWHRPMSTP